MECGVCNPSRGGGGCGDTRAVIIPGEAWVSLGRSLAMVVFFG